MTETPFDQSVYAAQQRLTALVAQVNEAAGEVDDLLTTAVTQLSTALQELQVTSEELHQQNEELLVTLQALEEEKARYQAFFDFAPDGYLVTDANGIILETNRATRTLLNAPFTKLSGKPLVIFVNDEERRTFRIRLNQLQRAPEAVHNVWETVLQPRDGMPFPAEFTVAPTRDDAGKLTHIRWLMRDITVRKQREDALRTSEHRYRTVSRLISDYAYAIRLGPDGMGELEWVTEAFVTITGYAPDEIYGEEGWLAAIHAEDQPLFDEGVQRLLAGQALTQEYRIFTKDNQVRWLRDYARSELDERTGRAIRIYGAAQDVTEQRQAEASLRISEARNRALLEAIPDAIAHVHRDGTILNVKAATDFSMIDTTASIIGRNQYDVLPSYLVHLLNERNRKALETGTLQTLEYEIDIAGKTRIRESRAVPVGEDEVITIVRDITERKQQEKALRRSETRNRALLEAIPDSIGRIYRDGTCLDIRLPKNFKLRGPAADMIGKKQHDFLPSDLAQRTMYYIEQALETGELQEFVYDIDVNGKMRTREARMVPDTDDEVIAIIRDITERRLAEEALHKGEERRRALLDAIPDAMVHIYRDGTYLHVKAPTSYIPVMPVEQMVGKNVREIVAPAVAQQFMDNAREAWKTQTLQIFEYDIEIHKEMRTREGRVVPLGTDEAIFILRDITERRQTERERDRLLAEVQQQSEKLRALANRLAETQESERKELARELHDQVGQNLSTLSLYLNMVQTQQAAHLPDAEQIDSLLADSQTLLKQTTQRVRDVMAELRPPALDDYGLPAALTWYARRVAKRADFEVDVDVDESIPHLAEAVENALFRIAQEAMTNIVKHAQATQVTVRLDANNGTICLTITDNGCGIDSALLNGDISLQSWGLLNMQERSEAVGGRFDINSRNGDGTSIQIMVSR